MLGLSGTSSYDVFVYFDICVSVFVYLRHLIISVMISLDQELSENVWFVWSKVEISGDVTEPGRQTTNKER